MQGFLEGRIVEVTNNMPMQHIATKPGIIDGQCQRCLNRDKQYMYTFQCAVCNGACVYCRKCIRLGRISRCTQLAIWTGPQTARQLTHTLQLDGQLTIQQQQASTDIIASLQQGRSHVLHAVCGAGKSEILFQPILHALQQGKRVCVATPRADVVLELYPRLQQAFPQTSMQALYGGAEVEPYFAQLIVATTHQLLRFQQAFDVMIVDEADAFPYTYDDMLQRAVNKAKRPEAPLVFVSATPTRALLRSMKKSGAGYSFLPRRYHGFSLPVPTMQAMRGTQKRIQQGRLPRQLIDWLNERLTMQQPFLVFMPSVQLLQQTLPLVQQLDGAIDGVYAQHPNRKELVLRLRNEQLKGLLTTTILERGITIKNVQVAVVCADDKIFDAGALIQISGRVGRHRDFAHGTIVFFYDAITIAMDEAIREIKRLNAVQQ